MDLFLWLAVDVRLWVARLLLLVVWLQLNAGQTFLT